MGKLIIWLISALMIALGANAIAQAQVLIEVAKVTCDQFLSFTITTPEKMAIWLSGYYHGKHGDTMIDTEVFEANLNKVEQYCIRNPKIPIITAVETVLKPDKR